MVKKPLSAKKLIESLVRDYGFRVILKRGSHIKLRNSRHTTIVPNHKELAFGTLRNILRLAHVDEQDFWNKN